MNELLNAKDQRQKNIEQLFLNCDVIVSIKSNVPGMNKSIADAYFLIRIFLNELTSILNIKHIDFYESCDGPYYLLSLSAADLKTLKISLMGLEDHHPLGRMIDLDLYSKTMTSSVNRISMDRPLRKCYLCELDAAICIKNQTHPIDALIVYMRKKIENYLKDIIKKEVTYAINRELDLPYKFGLITKDDPGSHSDMDYHLMRKASQAIIPIFEEIFMLGYQNNDLSKLLEQSRPLGILAEEKMLEATNGVNCYKGLIFVLGLFVLSLGFVIKRQEPFIYIFDHIKTMTKHLLDEFKKTPVTTGMKQYRMFGFRGVRGEAYMGFPSILYLMDEFVDQDDRLRDLLKKLILKTEDSCFLNRAITMDRYEHFKRMLEETDVLEIESAKHLTQIFIHEHLSFGGSADLLISMIFLNRIRKLFF
jgi:holo-ACP synthase / triphosphoribosyl-dephospho-CoA synthase